MHFIQHPVLEAPALSVYKYFLRVFDIMALIFNILKNNLLLFL